MSRVSDAPIQLLHAVTSSDEERMRVAFIDDLVKPFSGLGKVSVCISSTL